jgi:hypothetical protein
MALSKAEADMFGEKPAPAEDDDWGDEPAAPPPARGPIPDAKAAPADIPPPPAPKRGIDIWPPCADCKVDLNPDIGSKMKNGAFVHIGCPAKAPKESLEVVTPAPTTPAPKRGRPPKASESASVPGFTVVTERPVSAAQLARALRAFADILEQP